MLPTQVDYFHDAVAQIWKNARSPNPVAPAVLFEAVYKLHRTDAGDDEDKDIEKESTLSAHGPSVSAEYGKGKEGKKSYCWFLLMVLVAFVLFWRC